MKISHTLSTLIAASALLATPVATAAECASKTVAATTKAPELTVVGIAASNDSFTTLVAAVKAAGLAATLSGDGPFTIFAPTNEAFAKLPAGTVETLLKPENKEKLQQILTLHVVPAKVMAADVKPGDVTTVNGDSIHVAVEDGKVTVSGAEVIKTDIEGTNGVIHVIDTVILPKA